MCKKDYNPVDYPVLGGSEIGLRKVPFFIFEGHQGQAYINHHQTLQRLQERGGLSVLEMAHVITDKRWSWNHPDSYTEKQALDIVMDAIGKAGGE